MATKAGRGNSSESRKRVPPAVTAGRPANGTNISAQETPLSIRRPVKALIFELETLAVENGRKMIFESAKEALSGCGVAVLSPALFCRIGIEAPPSVFIAGAMQALKVRSTSQSKARSAFDANCRKALCERPCLRQGLSDLIVRARARGIRVEAVSLLDQAQAEDLMKASGLAGLGVGLEVGSAWVVHPYQQNIVNQVVDRLRLNPGTCISLVSSGAAAESALCAGTRVLAFPDSFTAFHCFSGVDEVLDTWRPEVLHSVLSPDGEGHR